MNVIILEDETPAFNKLSKYLLEYQSDAKILAWYNSVEDALKERKCFLQCDLVLSDIKLSDKNSFELFYQIELNFPIIFCTAYNKYMQDAFETNGIAYLIKPYSKEAFNNAMKKYEQFFNKTNMIQMNQNSIRMIEKMLQKNDKNFKQRFSIKKRNGIIIKPASNIHYFQSSGDFCILVDTDGERHSINYKISKLEKLLDPQYFFRINRSEIVNISFIKRVEPYFKNKLKVILCDRTVFTTSGARTPEFRTWLDGY